VVTGASSGLGRDLSIALARKGFRVLVADVNPKEAAVTLKMVEQAGGTGEIYQCDVTRVEEVQRMADHVSSAWGGLDLLVNNAGVSAAGVVGDMPIENWHWLKPLFIWPVPQKVMHFTPVSAVSRKQLTELDTCQCLCIFVMHQPD